MPPFTHAFSPLQKTDRHLSICPVLMRFLKLSYFELKSTESRSQSYRVHRILTLASRCPDSFSILNSIPKPFLHRKLRKKRKRRIILKIAGKSFPNSQVSAPGFVRPVSPDSELKRAPGSTIPSVPDLWVVFLQQFVADMSSERLVVSHHHHRADFRPYVTEMEGKRRGSVVNGRNG